MVDPVVATPKPPKVPLVVKVVDGFGAPLPGAEIEVVNFRAELAGASNDVKRQADAQGQANFGQVDPRIDFDVKVRKSGFGPPGTPFTPGENRVVQKPPAGGAPIQLILTRNGARLTVRVKDLTANAPLAGANVGVDTVTGTPMPLSNVAGIAGPFEVPVGVPIRFHADKFAFGPQPGGIPFSGVVEANHTFRDGEDFTADLGLHQGIAVPLVVHVVDGFGAHLPGATVEVSGRGAKVTGANGQADFGLVNIRDPVSIKAQKDLFGPRATPFARGPAQVTRQPPPAGTMVEFLLTKNIALLTILVNDNSDPAAIKPLQGANVGVDGVTGTPPPLTPANGTISAMEVPAGQPIRAHAQKEDFVPAAGGPFPINQEEAKTLPAPTDGQVLNLAFALQQAVILKTTQPVACPGLSYRVEAVINCSGTFTWTANNGGKFVDGTGGVLPAPAAKIVDLRAFKPDNAAGTLPDQVVTLTLTVVSGAVTKPFKKDITVHGIDFAVAATAITPGVTKATESALGVKMANNPGIATMSTNPTVQIKLRATCPQPAACAGNHRVGWLQTVTSNTREARYSDTLVATTVAVPIRDSVTGAPLPPFYGPVATFTGDNDTQAALHRDSPGQGATWTDPSPISPGPPPPTNKQLRSMRFRNDFTAWLTIQNIAWIATDKDTAFLFLRNFDWHMELNVAVDTSKPLNARATPVQQPAVVGAMANGQGASAPNLALPIPNLTAVTTPSVAPHLP